MIKAANNYTKTQQPPSNPEENSKKKKKVSFNPLATVVLIATKDEYINAGLSSQLWDLENRSSVNKVIKKLEVYRFISLNPEKYNQLDPSSLEEEHRNILSRIEALRAKAASNLKYSDKKTLFELRNIPKRNKEEFERLTKLEEKALSTLENTDREILTMLEKNESECASSYRTFQRKVFHDLTDHLIQMEERRKLLKQTILKPVPSRIPPPPLSLNPQSPRLMFFPSSAISSGKLPLSWTLIPIAPIAPKLPTPEPISPISVQEFANMVEID